MNRRLASLFARRYLFSPKSHSVINIISWVSALAIGITVAAMVILLSVFNGFDGLIRQMYTEFDPDIAITPSQGKIFEHGLLTREQLLDIEGVAQMSFVLEGQALLRYRDRQKEAMLRGVDEYYAEVVPIEGMVSAGEFRLQFGELRQALVGEGLAYNLGLNINLLDPIRVYVPRRGSFSVLVPVDSYRTGTVYPSGLFMLDAETDGQFIIASLEFVQELLDYPDGFSAVFVRTTAGVSPRRVQAALRETLGEGVTVLTRAEQKASLYAIMKYEKWGIFLIIFMVMVIASFSIVGSLAMLIIDKRADMRTIVAMGGSMGFIRAIFVREGMLVAVTGAAAGMVFGLLVSLAQQIFGIIKIPAQTFLVDSYPVVVQASDLLLIAVAFTAVSYLIVRFTVVRMIPVKTR
ncbi:MAG: ABC transporter permease [Rikenellaceae bacterium]|nr:ABC transporter permease [Rikenellaceae bacterium]MCL2693415.1 ABC transporter permease [Rikenellaceae bacterium]